MKRIIIICEGPTEQIFCNRNLAKYLSEREVFVQAPLIKKSRGGIVHWKYLKDQIERHLQEDKNAIVTTLIDYYGMYEKHDFPDWEIAESIPDKYKRMAIIENAMKADIEMDLQYRFIPYLQLHEFEGLLFNERNIFFEQIPNNEIVDIPYLDKTFSDFDNPEMINNTKETAPSYRLQRIIKGYNKIVYGDILAEAIGMERILAKSPKFNMWVQGLINHEKKGNKINE